MAYSQKSKEIVALIPARGGSKRLPKKNIKLLAGKPMIAYAIEAALGSGCFQKVIVTTEDKGIARIAKKYGALVIDRPRELASDTAKTIDVVLHAIGVLEKEGSVPQNIALIQPNSPLCQADDIQKAVNLFFSSVCDSVISMYETSTPPYWMFKLGKKYACPLFGWRYFWGRSQDMPKAYMPNGAVYVVSSKTLKRRKNFYTNKTIPYIMPAQRSIDIDTELDFTIAQAIQKKTMKQKKDIF